ncbi:MAG: hypothetical protein BA872_00675 [Desulfobacterales bacterium C00003060]|nr:MAG: hypothetical protein BA861_02095 [Desulfobacterales bacterium S3730MH5]OEU78022.1 MAG: hypothetical protein BA872_00675 [Desulfobacterales bacterium C00003060]OEU83630.1 MAG: hypothetical protein BA865_13975 [Desulfobacterales bacterium S5133MH4]
MRVIGAMLWGCLALIVMAGFAQSAEEKEAIPIIKVEMPTYDFRQVSQGEVVKHDFRVFNRGSAPLEIKNVRPG